MINQNSSGSSYGAFGDGVAAAINPQGTPVMGGWQPWLPAAGCRQGVHTEGPVGWSCWRSLGTGRTVRLRRLLPASLGLT